MKTRKRTVSEYCPHCQSEVEINATMRWHFCPVCGNPIMPCAMCDCDKTNCEKDCPLKDKKKPVKWVGSHAIEEIVIFEDYIDMVFAFEKCEEYSFKIHVNLMLDDGAVKVFEERFDNEARLIDFFDCREHLTEHEAKLAIRRLRKVAVNL